MEQQILALRPLDIHAGDYERHASGYRKIGGMFRLTWSNTSVKEKINELPQDAQRKCQKASVFQIRDGSRVKNPTATAT